MSTTSLPLSSTSSTSLTHQQVLGGLLFWSWNAIFLAFVGAGIAPLLLEGFVGDFERGLLPLDFALTLVALLAIPVASSVAGFLLRKRPSAIVALFYGLELPLFFGCLGRLFLLQEIGAAEWLVGGIALVGLTTFAIESFGRAESRGPWARSWLLAGSSALSLGAVGIAALLLLYTLPLAALLLRALVSADWWLLLWQLSREPWSLFLAGLGLFIGAFSASLFVVLPVAAPALYLASFRRSIVAHTRARRPAATASIVAAVTVAVTALVGIVSQQDQQEVLAMLATPPRSDAERRARLDDEPRIRRALVNAFLARHRYVAARGTTSDVSRLWAEAFGGRPEGWAAIESVHDTIAAPFLYDGPSLSEESRAGAAYESFFDVPIRKGERTAILAALTATHDRGTVQAGLLDRDSDKVLLVRQDVSVAEHGDRAEIELHDRYVNQTTTELEVLIHFALPESAVVTGLWMGPSADRAAADRFLVAPRGAARAVYESEVERRVDPALLEQVGPVQYRLRVFPIPGRERLDGLAPDVHVWLRYETFVRDGRWPLPTLLEKRNVFWEDDRPSPWSRASLAATGKHALRAHEVTLPGSRIRATPVSDGPRPTLPAGRRLAVLVDRSRSMAAHAGPLAASVQSLRETLLPRASVDLFLASAPSRGEPAAEVDLATFNPAAIVYYGGQSLGGMLEQLTSLARGRTYDAVLVLTDDAGADLEQGNDGGPLGVPGRTWLVHLGGKPPTDYDDAVLDALAGGGVATSVAEALDRIAMADVAPDAEVVDGLTWQVEPTTEPAGGEDGFARLAARRAIAALARRGDLRDLGTLDELHDVATRHEIVSPFSSFIVLVNTAQREALHQQSGRADRFRRGQGEGQTPVAVTGVPEPEEWLLIGLGTLFVLARLRRRLPPSWCAGAG